MRHAASPRAPPGPRGHTMVTGRPRCYAQPRRGNAAGRGARGGGDDARHG
jgi:hypothetical protein